MFTSEEIIHMLFVSDMLFFNPNKKKNPSKIEIDTYLQ